MQNENLFILKRSSEITMARSGSYQTKARQLTILYLREHQDRAVSASSILEYLHQYGMKTNITTVYRYLEKLLAEGCVLKYMDEAGEKSVFQYVGEENHCHEHLHLKCIQCGRVIHLDCEFMQCLDEHIRAHHGFSMQCSNSILYGYCVACQEKIEKQNQSLEDRKL